MLGLPGVGLAGVPPLPVPGAGLAVLFGVVLSPLFFGWICDGQTFESAGAFSSVNSVLSAGSLTTTWFSSARLSHPTTTRPRRTGPCASWVPKIVFASWFAHDVQNRKPSSLPFGLKARVLSRAFTTWKVLVSRGVSGFRLSAAMRSWRVVGCVSIANGRSWCWITGVVVFRNGRVAASAG